MAYNKNNLRKKMERVHDIYLRKTKEGLTKEEIYWGIIEAEFHISRSSFFSYIKTIRETASKPMNLFKQAELF